MKCKQYGRCSNFDDTECSGEDGSTPIACSHFSKIDLTTVPTPDLVRELCSREGVRIKHVMQPEKYEIRVYRDHEFMESSGKYDGPARIIVIRGDE